MNIVAMIPARSGSKEIVNKNMRLVGGEPLIYHTIKAAKDSKKLSRILFSTDSDEMRDFAINDGVEAPYSRPVELSTDTTCMVDVIKHCIAWLLNKDNYPIDLFVTLYPTSPFRTGEQIDAAIDLFIQSDADCLVSVSRQKHHPYWSLKINENGDLQHYFGKDNIYYRRQDMPEAYEQNGAIYIVPLDKIPDLDVRSMTNNTLPFIMDGRSSVNIDNEMDLVLANALMNMYNNECV